MLQVLMGRLLKNYCLKEFVIDNLNPLSFTQRLLLIRDLGKLCDRLEVRARAKKDGGLNFKLSGSYLKWQELL